METKVNRLLLRLVCFGCDVRRREGAPAGSDRGATSTEYAILLVMIVVVLVVTVRFFGGTVVDLFRTYPELISS